MSRLIDADALSSAMYHEAFEKDNLEMVQWNSGLWIRYKLFEHVLEKAPTVDAVEKSDRYRWHDLREDPLDLPKDDGIYLIAYIFDGNDRDDIDYTAEMFCRGWHSPTYVEVIAWKHFEPFEEETE